MVLLSLCTLLLVLRGGEARLAGQSIQPSPQPFGIFNGFIVPIYSQDEVGDEEVSRPTRHNMPEAVPPPIHKKVEQDSDNEEESVQLETVSGGWHGRNLIGEYDPAVDCLINSQPRQRHLYCPALAGESRESKQYCCGTINARYCCTAKDWQAELLAKQNPTLAVQKQGNMEYEDSREAWNEYDVLPPIDEFPLSASASPSIIDQIDDKVDDLPTWAVWLIVIGCIILGGLLAYIVLCVFYKFVCCSLRLLCCCCCCAEDKDSEERIVLVQDTHHYYQQHPGPSKKVHHVVTVESHQPVASAPASLYQNVTNMPPQQQKLYPALDQ